MGRPPKEGIDYSEWDVDLFDDPKIDKLMDAQGCSGFVIYFYLCQRAYATHGYYLPWGCDDSASVARRIGGGVSSKAVENTVALCLRVGLFDNSLFEGHGVLTGRGVQKRFTRVLPKRNCKDVVAEYWLLPPEKSCGAVLVPKTQVLG